MRPDQPGPIITAQQEQDPRTAQIRFLAVHTELARDRRGIRRLAADNGSVDAVAQAVDEARPSARVWVNRDRVEVFAALAAFAVLCIVVLTAASRLVEPDDYAYRASIVAITQGHFLTLSTSQADRLAAQLAGPGGGPGAGGPGVGPSPIPAAPSR